MKKKLYNGILGLIIAASMVLPVSATEEIPGDNSSALQDVVTFNVVVPTELPIDIDSDGTVTTVSDAKIVNHSSVPVFIESVAITPENNWEIIDFDSDINSAKVNAKQFGFQLQDLDVPISGECDVSGFDIIEGSGGSMDIRYNSIIVPQGKSLSETIANIVFTIGVYAEPELPPEEITTEGAITTGSAIDYGFESGTLIEIPTDSAINIPDSEESSTEGAIDMPSEEPEVKPDEESSDGLDEESGGELDEGVNGTPPPSEENIDPIPPSDNTEENGDDTGEETVPGVNEDENTDEKENAGTEDSGNQDESSGEGDLERADEPDNNIPDESSPSEGDNSDDNSSDTQEDDSGSEMPANNDVTTGNDIQSSNATNSADAVSGADITESQTPEETSGSASDTEESQQN